jgi:hypothetical protein
MSCHVVCRSIGVQYPYIAYLDKQRKSLSHGFGWILFDGLGHPGVLVSVPIPLLVSCMDWPWSDSANGIISFCYGNGFTVLYILFGCIYLTFWHGQGMDKVDLGREFLAR